jgi:hypothetical protein
MAKWCALIFGMAGYLLVVWYYVVSPYNHTLRTLSFVCPACPIVETVGPTWPIYLLLFGPANAAMYAAAGFAVGKLLSTKSHVA